jgi:hypothetical protein
MQEIKSRSKLKVGNLKTAIADIKGNDLTARDK